MKTQVKFILVFVFFFLLFINAQSYEWQESYLPNQPNILKTVIKNNKIYIFPVENSYFYSTDFGENWNEVNYPSNAGSLLTAEFLDENNGLIFFFNQQTYTSNLLMTSDGGENWNSIFSLPLNVVADIKYTSENEIYLFGTEFSLSTGQQTSLIYYSNDKGNTWNKFNSVEGKYALCGYVFADSSIITADEFGNIQKTTDNGESWAVKYSSDNSVKTVRRFRFFNHIGFSTGENNVILKTTDEGETWISLATDIDSKYSMNIIDFLYIDSSKYIIVGKVSRYENPGAVLYTMNGGENWTEIYSFQSSLTNVNVIKDSILFINGAAGIILTTNLNDITDVKEQIQNSSNSSIIVNYSDGVLTLTFPEILLNENLNLQVYDFLGNKVDYNNLSYTQNQISAVFSNKLANGVYFIKISLQGKQYTAKFIVY